MELAVIRRYLAALESMTSHPNAEVRAFAREIIATLAECPIHEALGPIHTLPTKELTANEKVLRALAEGR